MDDVRKIISAILDEIKVLGSKIESITSTIKYTGEVATPTISESLKEVIRYSEDSTKKILDNIDKISKNSNDIKDIVEDLINLDVESSVKWRLNLIKVKNDENLSLLLRVYELFSFQDLSSQQIYEVINLLEETKRKLIELIELSIESSGLPEDKKSQAVGKVHELISGNRISQEEVDEILKELGL
ncbi:MAG: chemotaxis protein CheZ [Aquificota bacterium]|jgi:chemotaxis protein CheZ|nr:MAG: chemotaxis protein CheZ [Aquificota bacterium]